MATPVRTVIVVVGRRKPPFCIEAVAPSKEFLQIPQAARTRSSSCEQRSPARSENCRRVEFFRSRTSVIRWASLFKDSISGTEEPVKLSDSHTNCTCMHKSKYQRLPAVREEGPGLLTLNKFRSRCERGRFTCSHAVLLSLHLARLRRGLASPPL
jgi:hypothetical protein